MSSNISNDIEVYCYKFENNQDAFNEVYFIINIILAIKNKFFKNNII